VFVHLGCNFFLPYEIVIILWSHRLSSLESDVLDLICWVRQTPVTSVHKLLDRADFLVSDNNNVNNYLCNIVVAQSNQRARLF